ncbi:MAG: hypothetical protein V3U71_06950 [Cocleimonas sp.]
MKYTAFKCMIFLLLMNVFTIQVGAEGLQNYLQDTEVGADSASLADSAPIVKVSSTPLNSNESIMKIIELVVAGVVASALIISLLVLFLGRWLARRDKSLIQKYRTEAEQNVNHITSATSSIREYEKETTQLIQEMEEHKSEFSVQKDVIDIQTKEVQKAAEKIKEQEKKLAELSDNVTKKVEKIQTHWDDQLKQTISSTNKLQKNLDENLNTVNDGVVKMQQQKDLSQDILKDFLEQHDQQGNLVHENSELSLKVNSKLEETYKESNKLIKLLNKNQDKVEKALKNFNEKLTGYEEQAYEQFDTSFQVADLARQELSANIEESRTHMETMRRQEVQSHTLNSQTKKNLESLDYSKIVKISNTLDSTQDMFNEMHSKVEDTRSMLDELKEIETDIKKTASKVEKTVKIGREDPELSDTDTQQIEDIITDMGEEKDLRVAKASGSVAGQTLENSSNKIDTKIKTETEAEKIDDLDDLEKDNTTIELTDYKMANAKNPIPFFRNLKHK